VTTSALAVPAASAVLVRDRPSGLEILMLRRTLKASFGPGAWVFPGGRVDPGDLGAEGAGGATELVAARRAAVRETAEEAGLTIDGAALAPVSHWCPPASAPRRFITWILVGQAPEQDVAIDGAEIIDFRWMRPSDALAARDRGEMELMPPTWLTLWTLAQHATVADALAAVAASTPELFETQIGRAPGGVVAIWHGDAEYAANPFPAPEGAVHRLWMVDSGWRYERAT
jgi:8-oxo-dGTP pyrophosphatase MutT (NUDIX family)